MNPQCDTMCCNHGCNQGRNCPVRKTAREDVEKLMGVWKQDTAKIGKRYHTAPAYRTSNWPKALKKWALFALILALSMWVGVTLIMAAGFVVGLL